MYFYGKFANYSKTMKNNKFNTKNLLVDLNDVDNSNVDSTTSKAYALHYDTPSATFFLQEVNLEIGNVQGSIDCSANPEYPVGSDGYAREGWIWYVSVAGKIGGASGKDVEAGYILMVLEDNVGGTEASVGSYWAVAQKNIAPATIDELRTGTGTGLYVSPAVLTAQGITFSTTVGIGVSGATTDQIKLEASAAQRGLNIEHTAATASSLRVYTGVNSASVNILSVYGYPSAALTGSDTVIGVNSSLDSNGSDADGTMYSSVNGIITATTGGRADMFGVSSILRGTRDTADTDQGLFVTFGNGTAGYTQNSVNCQAYGLRIAAQSGATYHVHTHGQWYGIHINKASTFTPATTADTATGIYVAGTFTNAIDLRASLPADEAYTVAGSGTRNHPLINCGSWDSPITVTASLDHFAAIQVNVANNAAGSTSNFAAARLRSDTNIASTANHYGLQLRTAVAHNVASAYTINASMNIGAIAIGTGSVAVGSFYLEGTGAITPAGSNPIDVVNITNVHSGTGVSNCLNVCNNTASTLDAATGGSVIVASNLQGPATNMLYLDNNNTCANGIKIDGSYTVGINMQGYYATGIAMGVSGTPIGLATAADRTLGIYTASSVIVGSVQASATIWHERLVGNGTISDEVLQVTFHTETQGGTWGNAICAKIDLGSTGYITGMGGVVCAEIDMPTTPTAAGTYVCFEAEINSAAANTAPMIGMCMNVWGSAPTAFDASGYLLDINGTFVSGATNFWYDHDGTAGGDTVNEWIKIRVNGVVKYIALYDATH